MTIDVEVAELGPDDGPLAGSVIYEGDIISPIDVEWDAEK